MRVLIILFFGLSFIAWKNDKLKDDKSALIGTWNWTYSEYKHHTCSGDSTITDIITPETEGVNYSIVFYEKGIVEFWNNTT